MTENPDDHLSWQRALSYLCLMTLGVWRSIVYDLTAGFSPFVREAGSIGVTVLVVTCTLLLLRAEASREDRAPLSKFLTNAVLFGIGLGVFISLADGHALLVWALIIVGIVGIWFFGRRRTKSAR